MNSKSRKALSWSVSILVHSVLIFFIVRAGIQYAFPEGEVSTNTASFDVVEGPKGVQTDVKTKEVADKTAPAIPEKKTVKTPVVKADEDVPAVKVPAPKFVPYQENSGIKAAERDEEEEKPAEEKPVVKTPPKTLPEKTAETKTTGETQETEDAATQVPSKEDTAPEAQPTAAAPVAAQPPADQTAEQAAPQSAQRAGEGAAAQAQAGGNAPGGLSESAQAPQYGTPGSMLDETKLVESPGNRKPSYPWMARLRRQEGTVVLRAFIRKDGHVDLPILEKSSGFPALDQECIKAYSKWKYQAGPAGWVIKPFKFSLTK